MSTGSIATSPSAWSPLELLSADEVRAGEAEILRSQLTYFYERSAFYRAKLDDAGVHPNDVRGVDDLHFVPFTEKTELRASLARRPGLGEHLAAADEDVIQVQATSGTSGSPSYLGLTRHDCEVWNELGARAFFAGGFRPRDTILHAWSMSKGFAGGVPVVRMLQHLGCRVLPIGAEAGTERILTVAGDQMPRGLCATPNLAVHLGEQADRVLGLSAEELGIEHLIVGGEPGGGIPPIRSQLERLWGATACEVLGNSDIATVVWGECHTRNGMHFVGHHLILVELIDPETGAVVQPATGLKAEIVYTALDREASPLLRFRSRDHVEVLATSCECGRTSYKIRCFGRTDDMLIVRGVNVWPTAAAEIVASFRPRTTGKMRIIADFEGHSTQGPLKLRVEHGEGMDITQIAQLRDDLVHRIREMLIIRPEIEMLAPGTLEAPGSAKVTLVERARAS